MNEQPQWWESWSEYASEAPLDAGVKMHEATFSAGWHAALAACGTGSERTCAVIEGCKAPVDNHGLCRRHDRQMQAGLSFIFGPAPRSTGAPA